MKLKLTEEQISLLEIGNKLQHTEDEYLYFLPIWFKIQNNSNIAKLYHLDKIPDEIKKTIEKFRL